MTDRAFRKSRKESKQEANSNEIASDVEAFLAKGGKITTVEQGVTAESIKSTKERQQISFKQYKENLDAKP